MSKSSGLGARFFVDGHNLSGDIGSLGRIGGGPAALDMTGIDKLAFEREGGLRDGGIDFSAFFNPERATDDPGVTEDRAHAILSPLPRADVIATYCHRATIGSPAACEVAKQIGYDPSRGADGSLTIAVSTQANGYGVEWGQLLTPAARTDTEATDGDSVDFGAGALFGLQAYLQVEAFDGDDVTIKLQQSSDDGGGDAWADVTGGAFAEVVAAPGAQRIQTARTQSVERYLRVVTTTSAGFTSVEFVVVAVVNRTLVRF